MVYTKRYLSIILLFVAMAGCQRNLTIPSVTPVAEAKTTQPILISDADSAWVFSNLRFVDDAKEFYRVREHQPYWLEENAWSVKADSMMSMIKSSRRYGLLPQHYHAQEISALVHGSLDKMSLIRLEVLLSDAFFSVANDLKNGRIQNKDFNKLDSVQRRLLTDTLRPSGVRSVLTMQEPVFPDYLSLKLALNTLLDTMNSTDRDLLMIGNGNDSVKSHELVQRIEVNLDRWRSERADLSGTYVWINVPAYMFSVVEQNKVVLESRVIVGAPKSPTPMFSSNIECFTVFPYWYMPRKIAVQEYLPIIKKDTSFLSRNNFDVLDRSGKIQNPATINWKQYNANNFPFTLRQREGKENSLGIVKFVFDNPYAVFVHDTNSKRLFKSKNRAFSHGCIRLEKAVEFSHYLIGGKRTTITSQTLDKYLNGQKRTTISLIQPVPIHIRYFTCEVRDDKLLVYPDIYKKDAALIDILYKKNLF